MFWLFGQTWIWILIAFILGLVIGYLISWFFRKKQVDVTEERVSAPAKAVSADIDAPSVDADAPKVDADASTGSFELAAGGGAAVGAGAGFLAGKSGDADVDVDAPSLDADVDVDAPALADGDRTEYISPPSVDAPSLDADADAPKVEADLDTPALGTDVDADVDAPALDASEPTQVMSPPSLDTPSADVDADAPSLDADASVDAPEVDASVDTNKPALSMIDTPSVDADAPSVDADVDGGVDAGVDAGPTEAAYGAASALPLAGGAARVTGGMVDRARRASSDLAWLLTRRYGFGGPDPSRALVSYVEQMNSGTTTETVARYLRTLHGHQRYSVLTALRGRPVLLICGDRDPITPVEHTEEMATHLSDAELVVIPGSGHMVQLEHADEVNKALLELLEQLA